MRLAARILVARAQATSRKAARKRRAELERELAGYATGPARCDFEAVLDRYPDGDQGLDRAADGGEVDVEQGAADDAALPQRPGPVERRGGSDADRGGQIPVGPPCITLQFPQQRRIKFVQVSHIIILAELSTTI